MQHACAPSPLVVDLAHCDSSSDYDSPGAMRGRLAPLPSANAVIVLDDDDDDDVRPQPGPAVISPARRRHPNVATAGHAPPDPHERGAPQRPTDDQAAGRRAVHACGCATPTPTLSTASRACPPRSTTSVAHSIQMRACANYVPTRRHACARTSPSTPHSLTASSLRSSLGRSRCAQTPSELRRPRLAYTTHATQASATTSLRSSRTGRRAFGP
jgi:hypothetical protein